MDAVEKKKNKIKPELLKARLSSNQDKRFKIILSVKGNDIMTHQFDIRNCNKEGFRSAEFFDTLDEIVEKIKNDLVAKSRVYVYYTVDRPMKLYGFVKSLDAEADKLGEISDADREEFRRVLLYNLTDESKDGNVEVAGLSYSKAYMHQVVDPTRLMETSENDKCETRFRFVDRRKTLYEVAWDGMVYPRYVRNSVNISNSRAVYGDKGVTDNITFVQHISRHLNEGRENIREYAERAIRDVLDAGIYDPRDYHRSFEWGNGTKLSYSCYNKKYVNDWREAVGKKTRQYERELYSEMSQRTLDYIDNRL